VLSFLAERSFYPCSLQKTTAAAAREPNPTLPHESPAEALAVMEEAAKHQPAFQIPECLGI